MQFGDRSVESEGWFEFEILGGGEAMAFIYLLRNVIGGFLSVLQQGFEI